jgi:hypothetical protein
MPAISPDAQVVQARNFWRLNSDPSAKIDYSSIGANALGETFVFVTRSAFTDFYRTLDQKIGTLGRCGMTNKRLWKEKNS